VKKLSLSVVIPCFNEVGTVEECVRRVVAAPYEKEILVVDDGSTDGTREVLAELEARWDDVRVLLQPENRGKGAALRRGFAEARNDVVLVQDADLEYHPKDYPVLLQPLEDDLADVVYGSRFLAGPHRVLYFWHAVANRSLTLVSNMVTDLNLTDMETCYKCFRREVIQSIEIVEDRFGVEPEITAKLARMMPNLRIYEVPISYAGRTYEEGKKIGLKDAFRAAYAIGKYGLVDRFRGG
jgi:glycosyltransferase involved in cell wall biosynthesis